MKEILIATTRSSFQEYQNKIDAENVIRFGIIFIFLSAFLWFTLALRRKNGVKRKPWRPFRTEVYKEPPKVHIGKRGGKYTEDVTPDGRPYRRYF